ncbi:MAG: hypothetical protein ACREQV_20230 [Candidatus Binatia bacterium]
MGAIGDLNHDKGRVAPTMWAVRLNTALRAGDAGKTIENMRALLGKNRTVVNLLLSDALMHQFLILGEK